MKDQGKPIDFDPVANPRRLEAMSEACADRGTVLQYPTMSALPEGRYRCHCCRRARPQVGQNRRRRTTELARPGAVSYVPLQGERSVSFANHAANDTGTCCTDQIQSISSADIGVTNNANAEQPGCRIAKGTIGNERRSSASNTNTSTLDARPLATDGAAASAERRSTNG